MIGKDIAKSLVEFFATYNVNYEKLEVVGGDGCSVNTGYKVILI